MNSEKLIEKLMMLENDEINSNFVKLEMDNLKEYKGITFIPCSLTFILMHLLFINTSGAI